MMTRQFLSCTFIEFQAHFPSSETEADNFYVNARAYHWLILIISNIEINDILAVNLSILKAKARNVLNAKFKLTYFIRQKTA